MNGVASNSPDFENLACEFRQAEGRFLVWRIRTSISLFTALLFCIAAGSLAAQQELAPPLNTSIDEVEALQTARCEDYLRARQWEDALTALDDLVEQAGNRWVQIDSSATEAGNYQLYVSAREYANRQLAFAPDELLNRYRSQVDPVAERWWQADSDPRVATLQRIAERMPLGSLGDDAILGLADAYLESGRLHQARYLLERLLPNSRLALDVESESPAYAGGPIWLWMKYAEANDVDIEAGLDVALNRQNAPLPIVKVEGIDQAQLWARIVWIDILTQQFERARYDLEVLKRLYPDGEGSLYGESGRWAELLEIEIGKAENRQFENPIGNRWPTLAGNTARLASGPALIDLPGLPAWTVEFPKVDLSGERLFARQSRLSDANATAVPYHPVVVGDIVAWCQEDYIRAVRLQDGEPQWPLGEDIDSDPLLRGMIASTDRDPEVTQSAENRTGVPRYTMFAIGNHLFSRVGNPVTSSRDPERRYFGQVWGVDLAQNATLLPGFMLQSDDPTLEFDGCPIADESHWYSLMRGTSPDSARVTVSVACYERLSVPPNEAPIPKWKVDLCDAEMPALALGSQCTHNLLTLAEGVLFINTNAGVVAAVDAERGQPLWLMKYPRTAWSERLDNEHYQRDLTPCVVADDQVVVAPSDSSDVFLLDRATGQLIWNRHLPRAQYLLGLDEDVLVFGGGQLWWLDRWHGNLLTTFPAASLASSPNASHSSPRGLGRGTMAGKRLYWTSREHLYIFRISPGASRGADGRDWYRPIAEKVIDLEPRGVTGGNLVIVDSTLLIAGTNRLWAFRLPWSESQTE